MNNSNNNFNFNFNLANSAVNNLNINNRQFENFNLMVNHNLPNFRMYFENFLLEVFINERAERFFHYVDMRFNITPSMIGFFIGIFIDVTMITLIYFYFDNLRNENINSDFFK